MADTGSCPNSRSEPGASPVTDDPLERLARIDDEALEGDIVSLGQVGAVEI